MAAAIAACMLTAAGLHAEEVIKLSHRGVERTATLRPAAEARMPAALVRNGAAREAGLAQSGYRHRRGGLGVLQGLCAVDR